MQMSKSAAILKAIQTCFMKKIGNTYFIYDTMTNGDHLVTDKTDDYKYALHMQRDDRMFAIFAYMGYHEDDTIELRRLAMEHEGNFFQCVNHAVKVFNKH